MSLICIKYLEIIYLKVYMLCRIKDEWFSSFNNLPWLATCLDQYPGRLDVLQ